jgi:hypothetical protein
MKGFCLKQYCGTTLGRLDVFRDWKSACAHLCDHVLTRPEADGWALLLSAYEECLHVADADSRYRLAKEIWKTQGAAGQRLYDEYAEAIARALDSAEREGWVWSNDVRSGDRKAFGLSGIIVVFSEAFVRSAMLPGQAISARVVQARNSGPSYEARRLNPLPREAPVRNGDTSRLPPLAHGMRRLWARAGHEAREARDRFEGLTTDLKRFRLFRKCAQFVRSELFSAYNRSDGRGEPAESLRQAIKEFDVWLALVCAGGESQE